MKDNIEEAIKLVFDYLNSSYITINAFCESKGITKDKFEKCLSDIAKFAPNIYIEYKQRIEDKEEKSKFNEKRKLQTIIDFMKNGMKTKDNQYRSFEYLDFCLICNLSIQEFYDLCSQYNLMTVDNIKYLKSFIEKNKVNKRINRKQILDEKYFIIINGKEKEITELEKLQILSLMQDLKLPMEVKIYKQLCRRYFNNTFDIDSLEKTKISFI